MGIIKFLETKQEQLNFLNQNENNLILKLNKNNENFLNKMEQLNF